MADQEAMSITTNRPKALFFDVFGTVVDWRSKAVGHLESRCSEALDANASLPVVIRAKAQSILWPQFAQLWRAEYLKFTASYEPGRSAYKTVDEHHYDSLLSLIKQHGIEWLWYVEEVQEISKLWHYLDAWPDSRQGLSSLNSLVFQTSTLSNGNSSLLRDLCEHASLPFSVVTSAEEFGAFKPNPSVYIDACRRLDCEPEESGLVAAHLGDLQTTKACGLKTIYVERPGEESWTAEEVMTAEVESWVDVWIELGAADAGLEAVAKRFQTKDTSG